MKKAILLFLVLTLILPCVPVFAVIYAAIRSFINTLLIKKNIPCDTAAYINVAAIKDNKVFKYVPEYKIKKEKRPQKYFGKEFLYTLEQDKITDYVSNYDSISKENVSEDSDNENAGTNDVK